MIYNLIYTSFRKEMRRRDIILKDNPLAGMDKGIIKGALVGYFSYDIRVIKKN